MLEPALQERVLDKLGLEAAPECSLAGLTALYAAWCQRVPFDNIRKLIQLRREDAGPLPGTDPVDFFEAWLRHGTGGTCWAGHTALHALLSSLGFEAERGIGTMLVAPDIPPNHATVFVHLDGTRYLVDASILHGTPTPIDVEDGGVSHGAWGIQVQRAPTGHALIRWRPIHMPEGIDCRIDASGISAERFVAMHEGTRGWSPFNFSVYARINRGERVIGMGFGQWSEIDESGRATLRPLGDDERVSLLVERLGISEELAHAVPADLPMTPPPKPG